MYYSTLFSYGWCELLDFTLSALLALSPDTLNAAILLLLIHRLFIDYDGIKMYDNDVYRVLPILSRIKPC